MQRKAIVIGATSGIGKSLVDVLVSNGYIVGAIGRRAVLLNEFKERHQAQLHLKALDVSAENSQEMLSALIEEMNGVELIVISAGTGGEGIGWNAEKETIGTNVLGFAAMANCAFHYFLSKESGHLVGISSVGAIRGGGASAYNASKAFVSNYLQGLRLHAFKSEKDITITTVEPGFVDTAMAKGAGLFWVAPPEKAAQQIYGAICRKRRHVYVTKRWRVIAYLLMILPDWAYHRL